MKKVAYIILILLPISMFSQNKWELTHNMHGQHPNTIDVLDSNYVNIFFNPSPPLVTISPITE